MAAANGTRPGQLFEEGSRLTKDGRRRKRVAQLAPRTVRQEVWALYDSRNLDRKAGSLAALVSAPIKIPS